MSDQSPSNATRHTNLFAAGAGGLIVACCVAGPALLAAAGGLALGTLLAPICAVLLLAVCFVIARRFAKPGRRC
jgi:hypothetical protein